MEQLKLVQQSLGALQEVRSELQALGRRVDELRDAVTRQGQGASAAAGSGDSAEYAMGRDRDPGDAVPPGVAVQSPVPLTGEDEAVLRKLGTLPKRKGRSKA